jgi:5-carboxymethyl-2-hydroxymuconic-semialdehyde dehydrogenase
MASFEENRAEAVQALERFTGRTLGHFIAGDETAPHSGAVLDNISPVDGAVLNRVSDADAHDVEAAVAAAEAAFPPWRATPGGQRARVLNAIADAIEARAQEIALVECIDAGQPYRYMSKAALRGAENFRFFADRAPDAGNGLSLPAGQHHNYTLRQPIGPVAVITPWNTPFMLSTWKIAPALAAGCTVVHKPAEWSPLSAMLLAEIMHEAGLPAGVANLVNGRGETAGRALCEHPAIRAVAFVGGTETGQAIMRQGAATLKRVHFELGGKNPVIVFADADLERALDAVVFMIFSLNGERCTSSSRLLIERSAHGAFVEKLTARMKNIRIGHPLDPKTELGPLIHPAHAAKVRSYVERARADGLDVRGGAEGLAGEYMAPTLIASASAEHPVAQDEIFGPVLTVLPFDTEAEAIALANGVRYGLAGYLWTENVGRALRVAHALEAGMVWVNSENVRHLPAPFGGMKQSGIGRDGGDYSFDFYMETKNVCLALGRHPIAKLGAG